MMVWLVYHLTTIVPNYSAFRKRNRRLFDRELLRQARRWPATFLVWIIRVSRLPDPINLFPGKDKLLIKLHARLNAKGNFTEKVVSVVMLFCYQKFKRLRTRCSARPC